MTIDEIMRLPQRERKDIYSADIGTVTISNGKMTITLKDYKAYSFVWEKSYIKSPSRSNDGSMRNINDHATFVTAHFKLDFSLMSIDDYRELMKMVYSGTNEFTVNCYDIVYNKRIDVKMYFSTEEMPKLWTIANKLQSGKEEWEEWVDLVGVDGCTIEMIGTNNDNERFKGYFH